ncbi:MAG: PDZ domain-containing protein [Candidatus Saccharicenans sp.]
MDRFKWNQVGLILLMVNLLLLPAFSETLFPAASDGQTAEIVKKASPAVVRVEVSDGLRRVATGVIIDKEGDIVTTALISPRDEKLTVVDQKGERLEANFLGFDPETRLAFLQVKNKKMPAVILGSSKNLKPGDWICALGISPGSGISVTQGIVSSIAEDRLRLNLWITPGMSGGPVLDEKGQLVAILRGVYRDENPIIFRFRDRAAAGSGYILGQGTAPAAGLAMAIPIEVVSNIFQEIKTKGKVEYGWLGVSIAEDQEGRVFITYVEENSPAEAAKIKEGDRIVKIDGQEIKNSDQFISEIRRHQPGQEITLTIERNGKTQQMKAKLGSLPEEEAFRELEMRFPEIFRGQSRTPISPEWPLFPPGEKFEFGIENFNFIGVYLDQLNPELAKYFGVEDGRGLLIRSISPKSPAEKAGLKVGDVIIGADGKKIETLNDLTELLQNKKKGEKVSLEIIRDRKKTKVEVEIAEERRMGWPGVGIFPEQMREMKDDFQKETISYPKIYFASAKSRY